MTKLPWLPIGSWATWKLRKMTPGRGEVWLFDLGMAEKVRPALPGAFLVQNVATYPNLRAIRRFGTLKLDQFNLVFAGLLRWLGHTPVRQAIA